MRSILVLTLAYVCALPLAAQTISATDLPSGSNLSMKFTVSQTTSIPGGSLKAGRYSLQVVDHLADRTILRITDASGKDRGTFLGIPNAGVVQSSEGPVEWQGGGAEKHMLRGFSFPGGHALEFVYPKDQAVTIAQKNATDVPAVDPAGDNIRLEHGQLSQQDMQVVRLWSLTETRVGPGNNTMAIAAKPYRAQATYVQETEAVLPDGAPQSRATQRNATPVSLGSGYPAAKQSAAPRSIRSGQSNGAPYNRSQHLEASAATPAPALPSGTLPQTASDLPLLLLSGVLLLTLSMTLRVVRRRAVHI